MRRVLALLPVILTGGCASLPYMNEMVSACQFYVTVATIASIIPIPGTAAITAVVDPICKLVLAGQPAPAGYDATFVREQTVRLEELEAAHAAKPVPHGS